MTANPAVACPHCEKKFKPKSDVSGKKIKCPFCKEPFTVPAAEEEETQVRAGKPKAGAKAKAKAASVVAAAPDEPAAEVMAAPPEPENLDGDENPYGVKNQDLRRRCPNCANEMKD